MRHSPEEGFEQLEKLGAIREASIFGRGQMVADLHREFRSEGRDTLVVAGTHAEISQLTDAIRQDRKEHGELGVGHSFGRKAWEYRWYELQADGSRTQRNLMVGSLEQLPNETAAQKAVAALRADINAENPRTCFAPISVQTLVEHYREKDWGRIAPKHGRRRSPMRAISTSGFCPGVTARMNPEDVASRIAALKAKPVAHKAKRKHFHFEESEPLKLVGHGGSR